MRSHFVKEALLNDEFVLNWDVSTSLTYDHSDDAALSRLLRRGVAWLRRNQRHLMPK